jgi:hypothetical protein
MAFAAFGVPVAMLALNEVQLAAVGGASDIEMVAGARYANYLSVDLV